MAEGIDSSCMGGRVGWGGVEGLVPGRIGAN